MSVCVLLRNAAYLYQPVVTKKFKCWDFDMTYTLRCLCLEVISYMSSIQMSP